MSSEQLIFYLLAFGTLVSAVCVVLPPMGRNPIHSAIALIVSFFFLAGIYALLGAHLLAGLQIIVYAGAIMVLFTFVIMLLNLSEDEMGEGDWLAHLRKSARLCKADGTWESKLWES